MVDLKNVELLIFDVGGVLRDSSEAADKGYRMAFKSEGIAYPYRAKDTWHLRGLSKFNGSSMALEALLALSIQNRSQSLSSILEEPEAEDILYDAVKETITEKQEKIVKKMVEVYKNFFNSEEAKELIKECFNAKQSVLSLKSKGYHLAIFTNTSKATVYRDIPYFSAFDEIVSEEDVKNKKPSGEGIETVLKRLDIENSRSVYIGDSVSDIQAARNAGCISIAVLEGMGMKIHLAREKPDFIFKDLVSLEKAFPNRN